MLLLQVHAHMYGTAQMQRPSRQLAYPVLMSLYVLMSALCASLLILASALRASTCIILVMVQVYKGYIRVYIYIYIYI